MQMSSSIPSAGFGGVIPSSTGSTDIAGPSLNPAAAPTEFALLFAGLAGGNPGAVPPLAIPGPGLLGAGPLVTGESPCKGGEPQDDVDEAGEESDVAVETDAESDAGPLAGNDPQIVTLPEPWSAPGVSGWAGARAEQARGGAPENRETVETAATPAASTDDAQRTVGCSRGAREVYPSQPSWATVLPPRVSSPWGQEPSLGRTGEFAPDTAADSTASTSPDDRTPPTAAVAAIPATAAIPGSREAPATPATPAIPATPATPGRAVAEAVPAIPLVSNRESAPAPTVLPLMMDRPAGRVTPSGVVVAGPAVPSGKTRIPPPLTTVEPPPVDATTNNADVATDFSVAETMGDGPVSAPDDPSVAAQGPGKRRNNDAVPTGLALGRNRAEAVSASANSDGPRPAAPGQARAALDPGAESRAVSRQPGVGATEFPAEKIAAPDAGDSAPRLEVKSKTERSFLDTDEELVKRDATVLGTGVAKGESAMSTTTFQRRPLSDFVPPVATLTSTTDAGGATRASVFSETASASRVALRAVNAVAEVKEQIAAGGSSVVNMRFSVAGADLAVRVESRSGEVHVTFRSDSVELRTALAEEWQAVSASEAGRPLRAIDPVFASAGNPDRESTAGQNSGDAASSYQRDPDSRHPDDPPVPSRTTQRFTAGQPARAPQVANPRANLLSHQHRLQAFA